MTHTTREVEELQWQDELRQMFPPQGRENGAYFAAHVEGIKAIAEEHGITNL